MYIILYMITDNYENHAERTIKLRTLAIAGALTLIFGTQLYYIYRMDAKIDRLQVQVDFNRGTTTQLAEGMVLFHGR